MRFRTLEIALVVVVLFSCIGVGHSAWWFSGKKSIDGSDDDYEIHAALPLVDSRTPFELEAISVPGSETGQRLLEELKKKLQSSCWHQAYTSLFSSCREVLKNDDKKMRLAYRFADCFLRTSGKDPLKPCSDAVPVKECTKSLTDHRHHLLLQFFIDVASMCHHLQSETFKMETEEVVHNLKSSAHWVEGRLATMQNQAKVILENTDKIFGYQQRLQEEYALMEEHLGQMEQDFSKGMSHLKDYTEEAQKQLSDVSFSQKEISSEQARMAYQQRLLSEHLTEEVSELKTKADDINGNVKKSLTNQEELLIGQVAALDSLINLKRIQELAMEESRSSFEDLTKEARANQLEFQHWQEELGEVHQRLADGSVSILKAQEVFASKQALVFTSLERLFALHNAILTESRTLKAFLFYAPATVLIYLLTGTKQTNRARAPLYFTLCATFGIEFWLIRADKFKPFGPYEPLSTTLYVRGAFAVVALAYVLFCLFTYRDYATLSYNILLDIQKRLDEHAGILGTLYGRTPDFGYHMEYQPGVPVDGPCFEGYVDRPDRGEDLVDDPDYDPLDDPDCDDDELDDTGTGSHSYNFRQNARRKSRPLAPSAFMLDWETEEMFTSLFSLEPR